MVIKMAAILVKNGCKSGTVPHDICIIISPYLYSTLRIFVVVVSQGL